LPAYQRQSERILAQRQQALVNPVLGESGIQPGP
jgi:hypothetical protein